MHPYIYIYGESTRSQGGGSEANPCWPHQQPPVFLLPLLCPLLPTPQDSTVCMGLGTMSLLQPLHVCMDK